MSCHRISDEEFAKRVEEFQEQGKLNPKATTFPCCETMAGEAAWDKWQVIKRDQQNGRFYINGKECCQTINFCPWCGKELPKNG